MIYPLFVKTYCSSNQSVKSLMVTGATVIFLPSHNKAPYLSYTPRLAWGTWLGCALTVLGLGVKVYNEKNVNFLEHAQMCTFLPNFFDKSYSAPFGHSLFFFSFVYSWYLQTPERIPGDIDNIESRFWLWFFLRPSYFLQLGGVLSICFFFTASSSSSTTWFLDLGSPNIGVLNYMLL